MAWTKAKTVVAVGGVALLLTLGGGYAGFFHAKHPPQTGGLKLPVGSNAPAIGMGVRFGIILAPDGSLWSWGEADLGWPTLGLGDIKTQPSLRRIGKANDWAGIAVGDHHALAMKTDGTIWGWGADIYDQLGNHTNVLRGKRTVPSSDMASTPVMSQLGNDWAQIAAGNETSYAIKHDGTLWAWGLNDFGQLGNGDFKDSAAPVLVGSVQWAKAWAGFINAAGIQADGSLWAWGGGPTVGNTSVRAAEDYNVPKRISPETNWVDVAVGYNVIFAVKSDGTLWAWGYYAPAFTGGDDSTKPAMTQIGADNDWQKCACSGSLHLLMTRKDGSLWSMSTKLENNMKPAQLGKVDLQKNLVAFNGGGGFGAAISREGEIWTWGRVLGENVRMLKGANVPILEPTPTILKTPWQLSLLDADAPSKK